MSQNVEVWNDGKFELHERFKGKELRIPPGECVVMDCHEAVEYKNQYKPIVTDGEKNHKPDGFKKIRIPNLIEVMNKTVKGVDLICHATGATAKNEAELKQMTQEHAHQLEDDDTRKEVLAGVKERESAMKDEIAALKARIAASGGATPKKARGRPKNEQPTANGLSGSKES